MRKRNFRIPVYCKKAKYFHVNRFRKISRSQTRRSFVKSIVVNWLLKNLYCERTFIVTPYRFITRLNELILNVFVPASIRM